MRLELERSETERLMVEKSNYKGNDFISMRIYFLSKEDEWLPTKKGVTFRPDQIDEIVEFLNKLKES